ncbi:dialkylresorcinol condensing enzyme [Rheinheimera sp. D18]|uniref:dialkylrecorsinol condensing enzyme n=1 Tax=Rheinheimera sp. D18 TaxID=2545632 RepID=UPI001049F722|nr:dialkylrecorsinol condensing enzyme [Rheinheimera sp. D18]QBL10703.1 dialkylresorcinol condensing enzyme [Rheinheimera sp. D18]
MRRVLVIHYSQTGQLSRVVSSVCSPLQQADSIKIDFLAVQPVTAYPFPWPFVRFFTIFPETVLQVPQPLLPPTTALADKYDLIILAYQVWFLSPSLPISSFLQSPLAQQLFQNTPVVTLIGCRNMWLMAQEKVKAHLQRLQANLVDNIALVDKCGSAASFLATPMWMFTGKQQAKRWLPKAGISEQDIAAASRFGERIVQRLQADDSVITCSMLTGLQAVTIDEKLIASERVGNHSFSIWARLLYKLGPEHSVRRKLGLMVYVCFLLLLIVTVVPITALVKTLLAPLTKKRIAKQKRYFAAPSGE